MEQVLRSVNLKRQFGTGRTRLLDWAVCYASQLARQQEYNDRNGQEGRLVLRIAKLPLLTRTTTRLPLLGFRIRRFRFRFRFPPSTPPPRTRFTPHSQIAQPTKP